MALDYTQAELNERELRLADFAVKVSRSPDTCGPRDILRLREVGLSDADVLGVVTIIAYQNMSTRIMESLGTVTEPAG